MLQIALPNKGALATDAIDLVSDAGYRCRRVDRELLVRDADNGVNFYFLRPRDIATYVSNGVLDLGITGRDLLRESRIRLEELIPLGFGKARLCYAAPKDTNLHPDAFGGLRVATSFVHLVTQDLARRGVDAVVVPLDGAVEVSPRLGVADVVADLVQSGRTLEAAGMAAVGDPIIESEAILVGRTGHGAASSAARLFMQRVRGILVAREYVMVEYDCPRARLGAACRVTPGIEAPTVAPLSRSDWVAVKAMAQRSGINAIMDALEALGVKGIVITDIRTCRI